MWRPQFDGAIGGTRQQLLLGVENGQAPDGIRMSVQGAVEDVGVVEVIGVYVGVGY